MKTILITFPDDTTRDRFLKTLKDVSDTMRSDATRAREGGEEAHAGGEMIFAALSTVRLDPPLKADHERVVALFISGRKMHEGTLAELKKRFQQECDSHKATVELRELREGEWITIQSRRMQQPQRIL